MVGWPLLLEGSRAVLEEFRMPAVEDRGLESLFVTQLPDRNLFPTDAASGWRPSPPACNASVASSCVRSIILNGRTLSPFPAEPEEVASPATEWLLLRP